MICRRNFVLCMCVSAVCLVMVYLRYQTSLHPPLNLKQVVSSPINGFKPHINRTVTTLPLTTEPSADKLAEIKKQEQRKIKYREVLTNIAGPDNVIILALVDHGYIDMTVNFYETSLAKLKIKNFLFVSLIKSACDELDKLHIPCFTYMDFTQGNQDSAYMSPVFLKKMVLRTQFLTDALNWGFKVLQTDTDVIYLKDPFSGFTCPNCDIEVLEDGIKGLLNAGFIYLRPTKMTVDVYERMMKTLTKNPKAEDQGVLNSIVKTTLRGKIKYRLLDDKKYVCGKDYFETPRRYFSDTSKHCYECIVVHNNWIVSKAAKVYRFREMLMWVYDGDSYYSNSTRKYLTYSNTVRFPPKTETFFAHEKNALRNAFAIGRLLNRTVILPRFHSGDLWAPLNYYIYIKHFDAQFKDLYRESTFLLNPKVPDSVKNGQSEMLYIESKMHSNQNTSKAKHFVPKDKSKGATSSEIKEWFSDKADVPVLRFHSLYGAFSHFDDQHTRKMFDAQVTNGFKKAVYRQY